MSVCVALLISSCSSELNSVPRDQRKTPSTKTRSTPASWSSPNSCGGSDPIKTRIVKLLLEMRTPDEYREFAAECYRLAAEAKTERHRKIMEEMARAWSEVPEEAEKREGLR